MANRDPLQALSRAWQLGDAHFSTLHARAGKLRHWPYHQARLMDACTRLRMPMPDWNALHATALAALNGGDQVLRITLARGPGARGYGIAGCGETIVVLNSSPFPAHYYQWRQQGIAIGVCAGRLGQSPLLAGLKTVNRLEQVMLKAELEQNGWPEAVVLDAEGWVMEAVTANLFWRQGERIYTPDLSTGGVCGTLRAWCVDHLGERLTATHAGLSRLLAADEVWLTNALMGVVPVTAIGERVVNSDFMMTRELQQAYEETE
ncbi:4-amino-4-deoxychorismate lyase [Oceanisphaera litoralis]|uniref:aminodeoxychorismate lyase n=1 Tax=Oceanisphaera litoralis TaxID=225144 RepID=UPI001EF7DF29|nr:aminodeoxychorismate lyase [Oceanisphaera litoralis]MBM7454717.1 4-amino-4-deoxychorismate lyase [Oceanisphaera litoralis]